MTDDYEWPEYTGQTIEKMPFSVQERRGGYIQPEPQRTSTFFSAADLRDRPVPPREWCVPDLVPSKTVTLFGGDGGTGKSLLALQLAVAVATGGKWAGRQVGKGPAIYISAEDDKDELHRRLDDILRVGNLSYDDVESLTLRSLAGEDALLAFESETSLVESALFQELDDRASADAPVFVVIDTLADVFPSNENDRAKVRQFIGILRGLALRRQCAIMLLAHPSLSGLSTGNGTSGSTAWHNSVRSRLYLERVTKGGYEANPDARVLKTKKANYGRTGTEIKLTWQQGVFVTDAEISDVDRLAINQNVERVFLLLLADMEAQGRRVNSGGGSNYAPNVFAAHSKSEGIHKIAFQIAMENLLRSGRIVNRQDGPPSKRRRCLAVA